MKAVIPAAGYGTRFLSASKAVPKEMFPIGDKPAIQWIVEEALAAGAEQVVIVTSPGKPALRAHFVPDAAWSRRVAHRPESAVALERLDTLSARVRFVEQKEQRGLGHAVLQAAPLLRGESEPVLILLGDALVCAPESCSRELCEVSRRNGGVSIVGLERVPRERVSRYGIAAGSGGADDRFFRLTGLVEKPSAEKAPSDLAVAGRYLLDVRIFDCLAAVREGVGGEIQLTDGIRLLMQQAPVYGYRYSGKRYDIGSPAGYREALNAFAAADAACLLRSTC